ncbi:MAG: RNA-binding S4 domain-containing protein [Prevotellaceae bacterium]|nr:RNA-binding S4 domain-containing protein [Prevotellaceae bacterium]
MESVTFKIREGETFIPLIQLLKAAHVVYSGGEAQQLVMDGEVLRNGEQEFRKRAKIVAGDIVETNGFRITVE